MSHIYLGFTAPSTTIGCGDGHKPFIIRTYDSLLQARILGLVFLASQPAGFNHLCIHLTTMLELTVVSSNLMQLRLMGITYRDFEILPGYHLMTNLGRCLLGNGSLRSFRPSTDNSRSMLLGHFSSFSVCHASWVFFKLHSTKGTWEIDPCLTEIGAYSARVSPRFRFSTLTMYIFSHEIDTSNTLYVAVKISLN